MLASLLVAPLLLLLRGCDSAALDATTSKAKSSACGHWKGWANVKNLFNFGDSYSATGFNVGGNQPSTANPIGNPSYPGHTSSNGPNYVGYLTTKYKSSQLFTYNIAYGGATVDTKLVKPYMSTVHSLTDQVTRDYMPAYGVTPTSKRRAQWTADNSLFIFFIGVNDVMNTYSGKNSTLISKIFSQYADLVEKVYHSGARNFLFLDVPSLQNSPMSRKRPEGIATEVAALKNWASRLGTMVQTLMTQHPDVMARTFSSYAVFERISQNPKSYQQTSNLKDVTGFCQQYANGTPKENTFISACKVPVDQYFWLNDLHPTFPVHDALAFEISRTLKGIPPSSECAPG